MNRLVLARVLPAIALALALPAWAIGPSDEAKENGAKSSSDQAKPASTGSDASTSTATQGDMQKAQRQRKGSAGEQKAHGPTAAMDRATPTEKSDIDDASAKHPPTVRMDRSTADQKSPASKSSSNDTQAPSVAK
jgi:hypothetical protein